LLYELEAKKARAFSLSQEKLAEQEITIWKYFRADCIP